MSKRYRVLVTVDVPHSAWRTVTADSPEHARKIVEDDLTLGWESLVWQGDDGDTSDWEPEWESAADLEVFGSVEEVEP